MRTDLLTLAVFVFLLALPEDEATARPRASIQAANTSPLVQVYGLPRTTQGTAVQAQAGIGLDWASHAVSDQEGAAFVRLDGETRRFSLNASGSLPFAGGWWALEVPYISHSGGSLDRIIDNWHNMLGLPEGDRPVRPRNELLYHVIDGSGRELLRFIEPASGPGDAAVSAGIPLPGGTGTGIRLEAPTGDPDRLLGSGGWDVAGWLTWDGQAGAWLWHLAGGGLYMADTEVLPSQHRQWAPFGRASVGWRADQRFTLRAQLDGHGPLYHSPLNPLGETAMELRLEGTWQAEDSYNVNLGFSEDVAVGTAPDITFHLGLARTWD